MADVEHVNVSLYFVGNSSNHALDGGVFDNLDAAKNYRTDNNYRYIYTVDVPVIIADLEILD